MSSPRLHLIDQIWSLWRAGYGIDDIAVKLRLSRHEVKRIVWKRS